MIHTVRIRGFKRLGREAEFRFPGHVVLAGPNNTGKTTVLQAIASWALALRRWRELNNFNPGQGYTYAPIARQAFSAVPLRSFDLMWTNRLYHRNNPIEIELRHNDGWSVTMEFIADSTEQIYVRPKADAPSDVLRNLDLRVVFIPPMTGIGIDEPVFQPPKIEQLLGLGRSGEVLRNLLVEANRDEPAWDALQASMVKLFGCTLLPPDTSGAHIHADYRMADAVGVERPHLDIASAGSGFQQVLMLLAFLNARPGAVLLLDEPDAHLHIILQDAIYHELRTVAARLGHHAETLLMTELMWKPVVFQTRQTGVGNPGIGARDHYDALQLVRDALPGLELVDGDAHQGIQGGAITGAGLQRLRWRRYEIESYLVHQDALARFVESIVGAESAAPHIDDMRAYMRRELPPGVIDDPLGDHPFLNGTKARKEILPPVLNAAGIPDLPYTRYHEIARVMFPEEVHPEVVEKLDAICRAFGVDP